jgi:hypothetical protein
MSSSSDSRLHKYSRILYVIILTACYNNAAVYFVLGVMIEARRPRARAAPRAPIDARRRRGAWLVAWLAGC